ncbi:MAG: hypothetical protein GC136_06535 [Alphaproteobacteria bacterium]|nr:hypothetical protein [Alphaproteobacteria bacterium]
MVTFMKFQILFAFLLLCAAPAYAGFNWVPGPANAPQPESNDMYSYAPSVPAVPMASIDSGPLMPEPYEDMPVSTVPYTPSNEIVQGFGKGIPLAVALPQILPAGKDFNFAPDVKSNAKISWQGGNSWQQTLAAALAQHNLAFTDGGASVQIHKAGASPAMAGNLGMSLPVVADTKAENMQQQIFGATSTFAAAPGQNLSQVLSMWAQQQNIKFLWRAPRDYTVTQGVSMNASFDRAVENLMNRYQNMTPQPVATLYPNLPNGPAVLVVQ